MKVAIYSSIMGDYEATAKPLPPDLDVPAIMFTDNPRIVEQAPAAGWTVVETSWPYELFEANPANGDPAITRPMLAHKYWKTHPAEAMRFAGMPDVEASIWLDGSMQIRGGGSEFVANNLAALGDDDWSLMSHPWRRCVFDEAVYSSTLIFRYDSAAMMRQHDRYLKQGHPRGWGLFATGHMVRRHSHAANELGRHWWNHNVEFSHQDQISLPVLMRWYEDPATHEEYVPGARHVRWNTNVPWWTWTDLHPHGA